MRIARPSALAAVTTAIALGLYLKVVRQWHRRWGATPDEIAQAMPLDERVPHPNIISTRAVTIDAPPQHIWPWIVQMGERPRAGYYSYLWVERMQGMSVENSERILPEYQSLQVGDALDRNGTMLVQYIDPGRSLVLGAPASVETMQCTWAFGLYPIDARRTRLVTRVRGAFSVRKMLLTTPPVTWPFLLLLDPGVFVMERKMLLEIKRRAERMQRDAGSAVNPAPALAAAPVGR